MNIIYSLSPLLKKKKLLKFTQPVFFKKFIITVVIDCNQIEKKNKSILNFEDRFNVPKTVRYNNLDTINKL